MTLLDGYANGNGHGNGKSNGALRHMKATAVAQIERRFVEDALQASGGNIAQAARSVGRPRRSFFELMRKHGITARRE